MIGPRPSAYACASQSYDISLSIKLKKNELNYSVFLVLMFMLMST